MIDERWQIVCVVTRGSRFDAHEQIKGIGGTNGKRKFWHLEEEAIHYIERKTRNYYVNADDRIIEIVVAVHNRRKYLKAVTEEYYPAILLSLPACPDSDR